jgi:fatty acid desaturase
MSGATAAISPADLARSHPDLLKPSARYAVAALARNTSFYGVALVSVPLLAHIAPPLALAAMPLLGLAMYRMTVVMHDCVHATLFASPRTNRVIGALVGALSGIEFRAFSRLHWHHHLRVGEADDPQGFDYLLPASVSRGAILWHLLRPLLGYNVFKLLQVYGALNRLNISRGLGPRPNDVVFVVLVQGAAAVVASGGITVWWLMLLPALSAATFGLFFAQLRGFAEHVAMPGVDPRGNVRSHRPNPMDRLLLYDLNFNLHREHHLYPNVPSCRLPALQRLVSVGDRTEPSMVATVFRRVAMAP